LTGCCSKAQFKISEALIFEPEFSQGFSNKKMGLSY